MWSWIPQRLTVYNPQLIFTTQEHGFSINTFYNYIEELEHCFIVIKTIQNEVIFISLVK